MRTYSFKDLSGAFAHPLIGAFPFAGQIGLNSLTISMAIEKTVHDVSADGAVLVSYISGHNGTVTVEMQQTSDLHKFLLAWYNLMQAAAELGDVSNWASARMSIRLLVDGSTHILTGISPSKIPDKPYAAQGQRVTWTLMVADIVSLSA